jgi:TonB family protein
MNERGGAEIMHASFARYVPSPPSTLDVTFAFGAGSVSGSGLLFVLFAIGLHGALSFVVGAAPALGPVRAPENVTTVELPAAPPPEPALAKVDPPEPPEAPRAALPSAPQAARAGALLTAKETAPSAKQDELVDFVTDPAGTSYGSGVVARGGTAEHAERGATASGRGVIPARGATRVGAAPAVAASQLSRRATLATQSPCAGFYPSEARADQGAVTLTLVVRADGGVSSALVVSESPVGEGFGKAARACLELQRFDPALDRSGVAVTAPTTLRLRFTR